MCRPYNDNASYYYPARKVVTVSYLSACLQIPYLINLQSGDAWFLVRSFFILYIPVISSVAFKSFFFGGKTRCRFGQTVVCCLSGVVLLSLFSLASLGGNFSEIHGWIKTSVVVLSMLFFVYLFRITLWLRSQISNYLHGEYSSEDDFPIRFASVMVFIPLLTTLVAWWIFLCDSKAMTAFFSIVVAVVGLVILLVILHPQRSGSGLVSIAAVVDDEEQVRDESEKEEELEGCDDTVLIRRADVLPEHAKDRLEQQIRKLVYERQLFLQPGLKRSELSEMLGSNRTYVSIVFKERFGSFYSYINTLRIEYAIRYAESHPEADRQEVAVNSGFGSVKTYSRVKKAYVAGELSKIDGQKDKEL